MGVHGLPAPDPARRRVAGRCDESWPRRRLASCTGSVDDVLSGRAQGLHGLVAGSWCPSRRCTSGPTPFRHRISVSSHRTPVPVQESPPQPAMALDDVGLASTFPIRQRPGDALVGVAVRRRARRCSGGRRRPHRARRRGCGERTRGGRSGAAGPRGAGRGLRRRRATTPAYARQYRTYRPDGGGAARPEHEGGARWPGGGSAGGSGMAPERPAARRLPQAPGPRAHDGAVGFGWARCRVWAVRRLVVWRNPDGETAGERRPGTIGARCGPRRVCRAVRGQ